MNQKRCNDCIYWDRLHQRCSHFGFKRPFDNCDSNYKNIVLYAKDLIKQSKDLSSKRKIQVFNQFCDLIVSDDSHILYNLWVRDDILPEIDRDKLENLVELATIIEILNDSEDK